MDEPYRRLHARLPPAELDNAARTAARLRATLVDSGAGLTGKVLVAYGGGKDSSYALAFVRYVQLLLYREHGETFSIRVATNRHAGMPRAVMDNIERAYRALGLFDDPTCELLLVDGEEVATFDADRPIPEPVMRRNRTDILMTGHRAAGDGRPTFCNACNLSMVKSFGIAAMHGGGVDVIITGDSPEEQRAYYLWITRLAQSSLRGIRRPDRSAPGFRHMLGMVDGISRAYFTDVHGEDAVDSATHGVPSQVSERLRFFSIYQDTSYDSGSHWEFLTDFLGFTFDEIAFSFSESDCGNPGLMAHLRGLKADRRQRRSYAEGITEYVSFAVALMRRKDFPQRLIDTMRARYADAAGIGRMREAMRRYALEAFDLTEHELVCMVWAPFVDRGRDLGEFLSAEYPQLAYRAPEIHKLLGGHRAGDDTLLANELESISGLTLTQLRVLYSRRSLDTGEGLLSTILDGDPHQAIIEREDRTTGTTVPERISGR